MRKLAACAVGAALALGGCPIGVERDEPDYAARRAAMVEKQVAARGVEDPRVLAAMRAVPRHRFVAAALAPEAYDDGPLPIGAGQTISQPFIVAKMTELLALPEAANVLDVGTGSGYQAAVLARIAKQVTSIEIVPELAASARERLAALGYANVTVVTGDGYAGFPERAPFDGILVAAAPEQVPQPLLDQLRPGAKLVIPIGDANEQWLRVYTKTERGIVKRDVFEVRFVPFVRGEEKKE